MSTVSLPTPTIRDTRETQIPARENVKFYQVGSYAVGNRLAGADDRSLQSDPERVNSLTSGHRACQGCGEALGARYALDTATAAAKGDIITVNATGCLEVFSTPYPESAWTVPWIHSLFGNAPAVASGVAAAMRAKGRATRVVAQGGDGGTVDIGMGCLSGMFERNDDVLYICYDNEAYMNTGVQRSGATPPTARTATTQPVGSAPGNTWGQGKDMARIAMAHEIPYVATATVADLRDLEYKVNKAMQFHGARYIHVLVPCPLGWGSPSNQTIRIARLATQCGLFPVFEAEGGEITSVTKIRRPVPVSDYLKLQRRFAHLFKPGQEDVLERLQAICDRNIRRYGLIEADGLDEDVLERILSGSADPEGRYTRQVVDSTRQSAHESAPTDAVSGETSASAMTPEHARTEGEDMANTETSASVSAGEGIGSFAAAGPVEQVQRTQASDVAATDEQE
ncbi:thiamine pyrophosphate-dependent enzyme [Nanchangia anserum]|uniref:thiamine pyrophosphate-dependent enzyme n=1 Tax=Nanchangia anserum TaxID=2692125 RepID=UPI001CC50CA9|nr:thiamine pyrophosphate-dependent enzyme [Nanchangia anserum]